MKTLVVLILFCLPLCAMAQIQKGRSFLSGGFGFSTNAPDNPQPGSTKQITNFNINAMYGYMIGNTWAIGISPSYQKQLQWFSDNSKNHSNTLGIGPYIRKYFPLSEKFYFQLDAMYTFTSQKDFSETAEGSKGPITKTSSNIFALAPGASFFITDHVALQATLGKLAFTRIKGANDSNSSAFDANFGLSSFTLGATVFLK